MSVNRHRVRIRTIPRNCSVYYWDYNGRLPNYVFFNTNGNVQNPDVLFDESYGSIYTSKIKDSFKNRDCVHSYLSFDCLVGFQNLPGYRTEVKTQSLPTRINYYATGKATGYLIPGSGLLQGDWQDKVVSNSATLSVIEHYYKGKLATTDTLSIVSWPKLTYSNINSGGTLVYKQTITASKWYQDTYGGRSASYTYSIGIDCLYLGKTSSSDQNDVLSPTRLNDIFTNIYRPGIITHNAPSSLTDDIFNCLAIPDVNNVENLKDFKQIRETLVPIAKFLRHKSIKTFAELYLWYKYTYSTTLLDLKSYYEFFQKWDRQKVDNRDLSRAHVHYLDFQDNTTRQDTQYLILMDTYNLGILEALGLDINLSNTWDSLPFSFVVDWFINIGDTLARIDHTDTLSRIRIRSVITTTKKVITSTPLVSYGYDTPCQFVEYQRTINDTVPTGPISLSSKNPLSHIADGAALVIANKR